MAKMITLNSCDGEAFEVEEKVAFQLETIKNMIEDDCASSAIPLPNVNGKTLAKVVDFCNKHVDKPVSVVGYCENEEMKAWDDEFFKVDKEDLFEIILAANYLSINSLLDHSCQTAANIIKDLSVEEVREFFHIENDFTPEEEQEIRNEYPWVFEE